jgi:hypothetical protein
VVVVLLGRMAMGTHLRMPQQAQKLLGQVEMLAMVEQGLLQIQI